MSLPESWIDKIFTKLQLTYGRTFSSQYEGLDPLAVKADWAHELSGFEKHPEAIAYGLKHLPMDRPPNVLQFRALCRKLPPPEFKALPAPKADQEKVRAMLDGLRERMGIPKQKVRG
jgi:hypothetical protein